MQNKILTRRKLSNMVTQYVLITVLVAAIGGYYGYFNYVDYQAANEALTRESNQLIELRAAADTAKSSYTGRKKDMDAQNAVVNQAIDIILPANEDFTNLARELDSYFLATNRTAHPVFLSNLSFGTPDTKGADFAVLPLSMNITGDETGLKNFLEYIENSGDLNNSKGSIANSAVTIDGNRLLDFANLNISYSEPPVQSPTDENTPVSYGKAERLVNASLTLDAFFQKPVEIETSTSKK